MVKINGEERDAAGQTITEYLEAANYNPKVIVVEQNGEIVPKEQYNDIKIQDGDVIEVVSFMGGG